MFHGLSAFAGSIWPLIQAALHSLEYGVVLPACNASILPSRALLFCRHFGHAEDQYLVGDNYLDRSTTPILSG
jgi:hypothetical protein